MRTDFNKFVRFIRIFDRQWVPYSVSTLMVACRNFFIIYLTAFLGSRAVALAERGYSYDIKDEIVYFLVILLVFVAFDAVGIYAQATTVQKMICKLKHDMYKKVIGARFAGLDRIGQRGEVISRMNADVDIASSLLSGGILIPVMYMISGIGATLILASFSATLCVTIYLIAFAALFIHIALSKISRKILTQTREETTSALSVYMQSVSNSAAIKTAGLSEYIRGLFSSRLKKIDGLNHRQAKINAIDGGVTGIVGFFSYFGIIFIGIFLTSRNEMSVADIVMASQVGAMIVTMVTSVSDALSNLQKSFVGIDRIFEVLELTEEDRNEGEAFKPERDSLIAARNLNFKIKDAVIFEDFNIVSAPRPLTALIGASGRGKSTLLRLLLKLYNYSGSLKLMGCEISRTSGSSLRESISYVTQSNVIFRGSIRDNLLKGNRRTDITQNEIDEVLGMVGADEWIGQKSDALDTRLSEGGTSLSGGQRQMLAIARALLMKKKIIFFDEAFAGMDDKNIGRIIGSLKGIRDGYMIIVTHDKRIMDMCDRVVDLS